jgi:hypothetical protein
MKRRKGSRVKAPPNNPEFERFTDAMRSIMKVSKTELQRRMGAEKRAPSIPSPASDAASS